mmetsp:Transcript_2352/g.3614  ORF Transcript_2352/g.3614 Transcript_2352/m.3614 type:complete len:291 (-) Transcript_2352:318-1190(-)
MPALNRLYSWVALTALSVVILAALVDQLPASTRNAKENYVIATASISLIFGFFFTVGNIVDSLRNVIIGNVVENGIASLTMAMWVIAIAFVQNPQNGIATAIIGGNEQILYANLYFFSWLTFLASVYTVGVTFRDNFNFGPKFSQWMLLFTASIVLLSTSISIRGDICANDNEDMACERTKYAVGVGGVGVAISVIAVFASVLDKMGRMFEIGTTLLATILYFFGVVFLTSASGPASAMGNMYFSVWGGCFVSFVLLLGTLFPGGNDGEERSRGEATGVVGNSYGDEDNI